MRRLAACAFGVVLVVLSVSCAQVGDLPVAPSRVDSVTGAGRVVSHLTEPPYGQYMQLGHAGGTWWGTVPANVCTNTLWGSGHNHSMGNPYELYSEDDPFTPEDEGGQFVGWDCTGGYQHSNGSLINILD